MKIKQKKTRKLLCFLLTLSLLLPLLSQLSFGEELMYAVDFHVQVNGQIIRGESEQKETTAAEEAEGLDLQGEELLLGAYTAGYDNRMYLSLRDLALLLKGSSAQFDFQIDEETDSYVIKTGQPYTIPEVEEEETTEPDPENVRIRNEEGELETREGDYYDIYGNLLNAADEIIVPAQSEPEVRPETEYLELYRNPLRLDEQELRFFTYQLSAFQDLYMNVIDLQMLLDISIEQLDSGTLSITTDGYEIDLQEFLQDGYFDLFNGVLLGDATTGEILFGVKETNPDAIASTSKLMTYFITMRYIELGKLQLDDVVTLSETVENLAYSGYGTFYMDAGQQVTIRDLLGATMIASSNESALALAEAVAGSEEQFVVLMNEMARLLGMDSAVFCNAHGLPEYTDTLIASKVQNRMSAKDLFTLARAVLRKYPEVAEYSSQKSMYLPSFDFTVYNTNALLYNMENLIGLKTGTTDEAGCCLVAAAQVPVGEETHTLVAIILGAESNLDRYQVPQLLLTWGEQQLQLTQGSSEAQE